MADTRNLSQTTSPEAAGFDSARLAKLDAYLQGVVDEERVAGLSALLARHGQIVSFKTYGHMRLGGEPMAQDAIFRTFSMSKPIMGVAMMILLEESKWRLDDPVSRFLPEFNDLKVMTGVDAQGRPVLEAPNHPPTMRELISHSAGFGVGKPGDPVTRMYEELAGARTGNNQDMIRALATIPLAYQPGTYVQFSLSVDIQGAIIERLTGQTLGQFLDQRIFRPLRMPDTGFTVPSESAGRIAPLYAAVEEAGPIKEADDFYGQTLPPWGRESGGAGLFTTTMDYARFAQMLANKGELDGARILAPRTAELMGTNLLPRHLLVGSYGIAYVKYNEALGLGVNVMVGTNPGADGNLEGKGTIDWGSSSRSWWWMDPENDLTFVLMTQRLQGDRAGFNRAVRTLTYHALTQPDK
ncbi:MAG: serine hydrolase domain-containing protein [Novosphingobium sp.]|nr:serine hydrolase domain-containing protein [Novosphingobium sp.]